MWGRMRPVMRRFLRENPNVAFFFAKRCPRCKWPCWNDVNRCRNLENGDRTTGRFYQLTVHESAFLVAMPEEHHLSSFSTFRWKRYVTSILLQCRPCTLLGFFAASLPAGGIFTGCYSRVNEPQTVLAMVSMGIGITLKRTATRR